MASCAEKINSTIPTREGRGKLQHVTLYYPPLSGPTSINYIDLFPRLDENEAQSVSNGSVTMKTCYQCQREIVIKDRVGRRDTCPGCEVDLRCCRNCAFYDTRYANACREPQTDPVLDKEAGNFCDFFLFAEHQGQTSSSPETAAPSARAQLEALFKKKS